MRVVTWERAEAALAVIWALTLVAVGMTPFRTLEMAEETAGTLTAEAILVPVTAGAAALRSSDTADETAGTARIGVLKAGAAVETARMLEMAEDTAGLSCEAISVGMEPRIVLSAGRLRPVLLLPPLFWLTSIGANDGIATVGSTKEVTPAVGRAAVISGRMLETAPAMADGELLAVIADTTLLT